jgi:hypothetical protein
MKVRKRDVLLLFIGIFIILNISGMLAHVGLTPAIMRYEYEPGMKFSITYRALGSNPDGYEVYANGLLEDYVSFDKDIVYAGETFTAYFDIPESLEKPGINSVFIRIREILPPERGVGVRLEVGAGVVVYVPYPGKYAEIKKFSINSVNKGEPLIIELDVKNAGKEVLSLDPKIEISSQEDPENIINTFLLGTQVINPPETKTFKRTIQNPGYKAGNYLGKAIVDYGNITTAETKFRIGTLYVDIVNWTREFNVSKINEFNIYIESRWSSDIKEIYASVGIKKDGENIDYFVTPTKTLKRWSKERLTGFLNAEDVDETGIYNASIFLFYEGRSTIRYVKIRGVKPEAGTLADLLSNKVFIILIIIIGVIVVILINFIVTYLLLRKRNEPNSKRRNIKK